MSDETFIEIPRSDQLNIAWHCLMAWLQNRALRIMVNPENVKPIPPKEQEQQECS